jgi:hypothetical protein
VPVVSIRRLALWGALFWGGGACLLLGRLLAGALRAHWLAASGDEKQGPVWRALLDRLRDDLGLDAAPRLVASADIDVPMTIAGWPPVLLVPTGADDWSEPQRRFALLHELAHVQRGDHLSHLLTEIGCALHWPNPLAWWAARHCRAEREKACDSRVLATGASGPDYADALVDFARALLSSRHTSPASLAMASPSTLKTRVRRILAGPETSSFLSVPRWGALVAVALSGVVLLSAFRPWSSPTAPGSLALGSPDTTNVPRELAQALLYGQTASLSVGALPEGLPDDFALPDDAQIMGGRVRDGGYWSTTVIATTPRPPETTMDRYGEQLTRQGWRRRQEEPASGFQPNREGRGHAVFCRDDSALRISAPSREVEGAYLKVDFQKQAGETCSEDRARFSIEEAPIPSLQSPANASIERRDTDYNSSSAVIRAEVESGLSLSGLADHYADELTKEGWEMISQEDGEQVVRRSWQFEDDSGEQWGGILLASRVPNSSKKSVIFYLSKS